MSRKSRKRNKKILAAIGIGLGAAAMASRKPKQSDVSQDSGRGSGNRPTVDTAKKDTAKKDSAVKTPTTIQDNKPTTPRNPKSIRVKTDTNKVYTDATGGGSTAKVGNPKSVFKGEDGYLRTGENATPMTPGRFGTYAARDKKPAMLGLKSGGRANYRSGGSVKSSGCEIRGTSPILMKGRK